MSYMDAPLFNPKSEVDPLSLVQAPAQAPASIRARAARAEQLADGPCPRRRSLRLASALGRRAHAASPSLSVHDPSEGLPSATTRRLQHDRVNSQMIKQEDDLPLTEVDTPYLTSSQQVEVFHPADARPRFSASQNPNRGPSSLSSFGSSATGTTRLDQAPLSHQTPSTASCSSPQAAGDSSWLDPMLTSTPSRSSLSLTPFGSSPMASYHLTAVGLDSLNKPCSIVPNRNHVLGSLPRPNVDSSSLERLRRSSPAKRRSRSKKNPLPSGNQTPSSPFTKLETKQSDDSSLLKENPEPRQLEQPHESPRASLSPAPADVEKATILHDSESGSSDAPVAPESTEISLFSQTSRKRGGKDGRNQPPRPPNPWILYRSAQIHRLRADPRFVKTSQCEISKLISYMWRDETTEGRLKYEQFAAEAKAAHAIMYPDYTYRPAKKPRRKAEPAVQDAATPESDCTFLMSIDSDLLSSTSSSPPSLEASKNWVFSGIPPMPISQWATIGHPGEASWLPASPCTVESLDSSIDHLLASLDYPHKSNDAFELNMMSDNANPLWSSTMNHSSDVNIQRGWGISDSSFPDLHHAQMVPFSAPAAFSAFDFGSVPLVIEKNLFDRYLPLWNAPLSPSFLASTPLAYHPSRFELSSSSSSASSIASADDLDGTFSSPGTIASSVTSASTAPSPASSTESPLLLDHRTPFTNINHTPLRYATSTFEKGSTFPRRPARCGV